eukprot:GEZU01000800.1.p1 GENE.GEZU01000800.1~~GEZU01000800.1.p1  ORF type:complete len:318 (-),score=89.35 GEZU01000800.1:105-1058(-)
MFSRVATTKILRTRTTLPKADISHVFAQHHSDRLKSRLRPNNHRFAYVHRFFFSTSRQNNKMKVLQVPILSDNYSYIIVDEDTNEAAIVDPAEPKKVIDVVNKHGFKLTKVLTTHKHWDHAGGNNEIANTYPNLDIIGSKMEQIPASTISVVEGDKFKIGNHEVEVLFTPCHTRGHILYLVKGNKDKNEPDHLFCGDTLFVGGCGRFFEGDGSQMYKNMSKIAQLKPDTKVYPGHEYTVKNLEFALTIEPDNQALKDKYAWAKAKRANNESTIPSTVGEELSYNPFMRTDHKSVQARVQADDPVTAITKIRRLKDNF